MERFGRIDKAILLDLCSIRRRGNRLTFKDRSQIIYNIYVMKSGNFESPFRDIIKNNIDNKKYNSLQVSVTRSLSKLERKGLVERKEYEINRNRGVYRARDSLGILGRKYYFSLTAAGVDVAKSLAEALKIDVRGLNRRLIANNVLRLRTDAL